MTYKTTLDNLAKGITVAITILFIGIICLPFFLSDKDEVEISVSVYSSLVFVIIYVVTLGFRPIYYEVVTNKVVIHRWFKDIAIEKIKIISIEQINQEKIKGSLRVFGVGGLFGYFGEFTNDEIGTMTWYATRRDKLILIITSDNKKIILTPDEPDTFLAEAKAN